MDSTNGTYVENAGEMIRLATTQLANGVDQKAIIQAGEEPLAD